jgi:hypothetical protein
MSGRFFHPQISRLIYDSLVAPSDFVRRAEHIAHAFLAMLDQGEPAGAFLRWLGSTKIGKSRSRGTLMLDEVMRVAILRALWPRFELRGPTEQVAPLMGAWHRAALMAGIDMERAGVKSRVETWWREADEASHLWPILFQMVWDVAAREERPYLLMRGRTWLADHVQAPLWPWIFHRLFALAHDDGPFQDLGYRWLEAHPDHLGWPSVWGLLFDEHARCGFPEPDRQRLIQFALVAIPVQPEGKPDLAVWDRARRLGAPLSDLLAAVLRKLTVVRSPHEIDQGVDFLLRSIPEGQVVANLTPILQNSPDGGAWNYIWRSLVERRPKERDLLPIGRDRLAGRESQPEWPYVWQKLIDHGFEHATLLPIGRDRLAGRESQPEWSHVWRKLIDQDFEHATLLPIGRHWLAGRESQPEWSHVWQKLIDHGFEHATLLPIGRHWLAGRESQPEWAHVWQKLIDHGFEHATLLPIGRHWLAGSESQPEWNYIWQKLIDQDFEHATLLPIGQHWLAGRESLPEWPHVWRKLVDVGYDREKLVVIGRDWLSQHRGQVGSHRVATYRMIAH